MTHRPGIAALWLRFCRWLTRHGPPPPLAALPPPAEPPHHEPEPEPAPPPAPKAKRPRRQTARLKADILDRLAHYQIYAKRLKRYDKEAFAQYRRIGAFVLNNDFRAHAVEIEPVFMKTLPGFGAIALGIQAHTGPIGYIPSRFCYFMKIARPGGGVEHANIGVTYRFCLYWDDEDTTDWKDDHFKRLWSRRGHGCGEDYMINLAPDGAVRALRVLKSQHQTIRAGRPGTIQVLTSRGKVSTRHSGYRPAHYVTHQRWGLPTVPDGHPDANENPAAEICRIFTTLVNFWVQASYHSMIRITATKDGIVMPFIVDATDTPQFFADREPVVIDGVKKRIFHLVRAHARNTAKGAKGVKLHFAGLRKFKWNGYDIAITVPGRDHWDLAEFNVGALEDVTDEEIAAEKHLNYFEVSEWLADKIDAPGKEQAA